MSKPVSNAYKLLDLVVKNISYFEQHLPELAWVMMHYEATIQMARSKFDDYVNPKDAILDLTDIPQKHQDLIYDAWGVSVSNHGDFNDPIFGPALLRKPNKTVTEWIKLQSNPKFQYHSLYPNRQRILDSLLCVNGTGRKWIEFEGKSYIAEVGPAGCNELLFSGFTQAGKTIRPDLKARVQKLTAGFGVEARIRQGIASAKKLANGWDRHVLTGKITKPKQNKVYKMLVRLQNDMGYKAVTPDKAEPDYYPICEYANIENMPANAHESYKLAALVVCAEILLYPKARNFKENQKYAKKFLAKHGYSKWKPEQIIATFAHQY